MTKITASFLAVSLLFSASAFSAEAPKVFKKAKPAPEAELNICDIYVGILNEASKSIDVGMSYATYATEYKIKGTDSNKAYLMDIDLINTTHRGEVMDNCPKHNWSNHELEAITYLIK